MRLTDAPTDSVDYVLTAEHPRFATLGLASVERTVRLVGGSDASLVIATPSAPTLVAALCPLDGESVIDAAGQTRLGMVIGRALDAAGEPLPAGSRVVVEWPSDEGVRADAGTRMVRCTANTDADGRFRLCPIPVDRTVQLFTERGGAAGPRMELVIPQSGLAEMELWPDP